MSRAKGGMLAALAAVVLFVLGYPRLALLAAVAAFVMWPRRQTAGASSPAAQGGSAFLAPTTFGLGTAGATLSPTRGDAPAVVGSNSPGTAPSGETNVCA